MGWVARRILGVAVAALGITAACGSRTGLLVDDEDRSFDGGLEASVEASVDASDSGEGEAEAGPHPVCRARTCAEQSYSCGENGDGCGNLIECGTCPTPEICGAAGFSTCGGGYGLGPDGGPLCTPTTCKALGFDCGPAADGCGGLLQCGTCQAPLVCGAAGSPGRCGSACFGLCPRQVQCDSGTTTVTGTVVAGTLPIFGAPDPIYNALVYVPNAKVQPFPAGVACNQCGAEVSGDPLVEAQTAADGTFTLQNVPAGADIPLVIQLGRWRRQITIPFVAPCTNTALTADQTRLPRNKSEGDIPLTAIATGFADAIECVLMKMGVDQAEFTDPGAGGRVNLYVSNGATLDAATPQAESLWSSSSTLATYDEVLLPCEGQQLDKSPSDQQDMITYTNTGGRIFTTHYGYTWLYDDPPFSGTANWNTASGIADATQVGTIDTSTATGQEFQSWLSDVGALSGPGQITLANTRYDVLSANPPSEQFIYATPPQQTLQFDFYTPVGNPMSQQCGRVIFSDFHVIDQQSSGVVFPAECSMVPMTAQEKALEFMLFDLASCVPAPQGPCTPQSCADQGIDCGPAGDGCGKTIQCGSCAKPQTCGGGGQYGRCGYPDAGSCTPQTCAQLGYDCGETGDGCGGSIQCGVCTPPAICGGAGKPNVCGI